MIPILHPEPKPCIPKPYSSAYLSLLAKTVHACMQCNAQDAHFLLLVAATCSVAPQGRFPHSVLKRGGGEPSVKIMTKSPRPNLRASLPFASHAVSGLLLCTGKMGDRRSLTPIRPYPTRTAMWAPPGLTRLRFWGPRANTLTYSS